MTKSASTEGTRQEGSGCKNSVKACRQCLLFHFLLLYQVNPCSAELCLLAMSKVRKEILKRFVYIMGIRQVFSRGSLGLKVGNSFPQQARQEQGGAGTRVRSPTRAPMVSSYSTKKWQYRMPVPPKQICLSLLFIIIIRIIYPYYCITSDPSWTQTLCCPSP